MDTIECLASVGEECIEKLLNPIQSQIARLSFEDELDCESNFMIPVIVKIPAYIYIPNVFSSNNDGMNDQFAFYVTDFVRTVSKVQIFNRWGH